MFKMTSLEEVLMEDMFGMPACVTVFKYGRVSDLLLPRYEGRKGPLGSREYTMKPSFAIEMLGEFCLN